MGPFHPAAILLLLAGAVRAQPLDIVLALDTSPGTEHAAGLVQEPALRDGDRAGVVAFASSASVVTHLTGDRDRIAAALQRAGLRVGVGVNGVAVNPQLTVNVSDALLRALEMFDGGGDGSHKRAVLVLFGAEDPRLSGRMEAIRSLARSTRARIYAVAVRRSDPPGVTGLPGERPRPTALPANHPDRCPTLSARLLSGLAKDTGGRLYEGAWDFPSVLKAARKN